MLLARPVKIIMIATRQGPFLQAAAMAREAGALVTTIDSDAAAERHLRHVGGDMVLMDVDLDVPAFISRLRAEGLAVPIVACGSDSPTERAIAAVRSGARDYVSLPARRERIAAAILSVSPFPYRIVADCEHMKGVLKYGLSMAATTAPILIQGEPGTGKEMIARLIHAESNRSGPFLAIECQGVAPDVLGPELFGHQPGTRSRRLSRIREASGGTIFLRGIEALTPLLQAQLLDALHAGEVSAMGAPAQARPAARLITSSSAMTPALIDKYQFRADLLARLSLAEISLPPLRERGADIDALLRSFAKRFADMYELPERPYDDEAIAILHNYPWPGNVRELEETVHRATLLSRSSHIGADALVQANGARLENPPADADDKLPVDQLVGHTVAEVERKLILETLESCGGNRTSASSILGISVRTLRNKLKTFMQAGISISPSH